MPLFRGGRALAIKTSSNPYPKIIRLCSYIKWEGILSIYELGFLIDDFSGNFSV